MADRFSDKFQAAAYAKYRTSCPNEAITKTVGFLKKEFNGSLTKAVDVGCGTGLSTRILAPYFENVLGTDLSEAQLEEARNDPKNPPNVKFNYSAAECLPLEDNSVQLITVSHALHWFDLERFWNEVKRVLVPNGVLMAWRDCLSKIIVADPTKTEALTSLYLKFRYESSVPYWDTRNHYASQDYKTVDFPFKVVERNENFMHCIKTTMKDQIGWYYSWSPYQKMKEADPQLADRELKHIIEKSEDILGSLDVEVITEMKGVLILCRHIK